MAKDPATKPRPFDHLARLQSHLLNRSMNSYCAYMQRRDAGLSCALDLTFQLPRRIGRLGLNGSRAKSRPAFLL